MREDTQSQKEGFFFFRGMFLVVFGVSYLLACSSKEMEDDSDKSQQEKTIKVETKKDMVKKNEQPIVTTSKPKTSKAISESAGNAAEHKFDEIYIVPNRFPLKETEEEEEGKEKDKEALEKPPKK